MNRFSEHILIFAFLFLFAGSDAYAVCPSSAPEPSENSETVVMMFGDSISLGFNHDANRSVDCRDREGGGRENYGRPSEHLNQILEDSRRPAIVLNWGYGGTPSGPSLNPTLDTFGRDGLSRIDATLSSSQASFPGRNYFVLINYGTNDSGFSIAPSDTRFYMRSILKKVYDKGSNFTPLVSNLISCSSGCNPAPYNDNIAAAANDAAAAAGRTAIFVNQNSNFFANGGVLTDGVHPSDASYEILSQHWFDEALADLIPRKAFAVGPLLLLLLDDDEAPVE